MKRTIAKEFKEDYQVIANGQRLVQVRLSDEHVNAMKQYATKMSYGLLLRNVPGAAPDINKTNYRWYDYYYLTTHGLFQSNLEHIKRLTQTAAKHNLLFGQAWEGLVEYYGCKTNAIGTTGFIYMEFYKAIGIWVNFTSNDELTKS